MAPAAATPAPGGAGTTRLLSKRGFLVPCPNTAATTTVTLGRRAGVNRTVILGVAARSRPRDGEWGADPDPSPGAGRMVDEDMATLRRRIREARAALSEDDIDSDTGAEAGAVLPLPAGWTELERRHRGSYVAGVRGGAGLLEALLVGARPGLGAGVIALLLLGVPASVFLLCAKLIQAADAISSAVNGQ